jgi:predicted HicB family RNase H-like nuclease
MAKIYCKNLQVDIDEELKKEIKVEAARRGVTLGELVEKALQEFVEDGTNKTK